MTDPDLKELEKRVTELEERHLADVRDLFNRILELKREEITLPEALAGICPHCRNPDNVMKAKRETGAVFCCCPKCGCDWVVEITADIDIEKGTTTNIDLWEKTRTWQKNYAVQRTQQWLIQLLHL